MRALRNWPREDLMRLPWDFSRSLLMSLANKDVFGDVSKFCFFVRYSRSGHSLVASSLDAHRNIVISDEARVIKYFASGFSTRKVYELILSNSIASSRKNIASSRKNRERAGYQFAVEGQYQGIIDHGIKVIGDKDGGFNSQQVLRNSHAYEKAFERLGDSLRILNVVRNPYDIASTIYRRAHGVGRQPSLQHTSEYVLKFAEGVDRIKKISNKYQVFDLQIEKDILDPKQKLKDICSFLGVPGDEDYIDACSNIVFDKPKVTRSEAPWKEEDISFLSERIRKYDFLMEYSFHE